MFIVCLAAVLVIRSGGIQREETVIGSVADLADDHARGTGGVCFAGGVAMVDIARVDPADDTARAVLLSAGRIAPVAEDISGIVAVFDPAGFEKARSRAEGAAEQ